MSIRVTLLFRDLLALAQFEDRQRLGEARVARPYLAGEVVHARTAAAGAGMRR
jgi:hypothetical protein